MTGDAMPKPFPRGVRSQKEKREPPTNKKERKGRIF